MEDTLRVSSILSLETWVKKVLILVLMEDTLRVIIKHSERRGNVLILVLMEDTLRGQGQGFCI